MWINFKHNDTPCYFGPHFGRVDNIDGLVQDCSNFIANALEPLQSFIKPSINESAGGIYCPMAAAELCMETVFLFITAR